MGGKRVMTCFGDLPNHGEIANGHNPVLVMPVAPPPKRRRVWAQRVWLVVFVLFCLEVGIILVWCPWTKIWSENSILLSYPTLRGFLMLSFVRGAISGLGLVNIWMGIAEAIRYREVHDA